MRASQLKIARTAAIALEALSPDKLFPAHPSLHQDNLHRLCAEGVTEKWLAKHPSLTPPRMDTHHPSLRISIICRKSVVSTFSKQFIFVCTFNEKSVARSHPNASCCPEVRDV